MLGPNGAGKTTTVEILEGYRDANAGTIRVLGMDPATGRHRLAGAHRHRAAGQRRLPVHERARGRRSCSPATTRNPRPVGEVLAAVGLADQAQTRVRTLSGGQRRRLDVALALVGNPEVLFLDEPTTGFDPSARRGAWEMIAGLAAAGTTILLTTHYMDEAQSLADRVAVMRAGEIVAMGPPASLGAGGRPQIRFVVPDGAEASLLASLAGGTILAHRRAAGARGRRPHAGAAQPDRLGARPRLHLDRLEVARPSLEDVYLALTAAAP